MVNPEFLKRFVPFNVLSEEVLKVAVKHVEMIKAKQGELVLKRGKALSCQYYLLFGSVDLVDNRFCATKLESGIDGSETTLNEGGKAEKAVRVNSLEATLFSININILNELIKDNEHLSNRNKQSTRHVDSDWMDNLLSSPLFRFIPSSHIQTLFSHFETRDVCAGDAIVKEGEKGDHFYVIASGYARIQSKSSDKVSYLSSGQYFGEESLVGNTTRNATITMECDGVLKVLDDETFANLLQNPVLKYIRDEGLRDIEKPYQLVDVRMPIEYKIEHVPGSQNIPLPRLRDKLKQMPSSQAYVVLDDSGGRANVAAHLMTQAGLEAFILADDNDPKMVSSL